MTRFRARLINAMTQSLARREARTVAAIINSNDGGLLVHVAIEQGRFRG